MAKFVYKPNPRVTAVFDDLEQFGEFCRDYGYRFEENDLYNWKAYAWQQYNKFISGKSAKNMWDEDLRRQVRTA